MKAFTAKRDNSTKSMATYKLRYLNEQLIAVVINVYANSKREAKDTIRGFKGFNGFIK